MPLEESGICCTSGTGYVQVQKFFNSRNERSLPGHGTDNLVGCGQFLDIIMAGNPKIQRIHR